MFMFSIDWISFLMDILKSLLVAGLTGIVAVFLTKGYFKKLMFANKLKQYGFLQSVQVNQITIREKKKIFNDSDEVKMIFVSGRNFICESESFELIKEANDRGTKIKILIANENSELLTDIEKLEKKKGIRDKDTFIKDEIVDLTKKVSSLKNVEIRYYNTEYRLPMVLASKYNKEYGKITTSWLTVTLPPYKSKSSFILRGLKKDNELLEENDSTINFIEMMEEHFDYIWNSYPNIK